MALDKNTRSFITVRRGEPDFARGLASGKYQVAPSHRGVIDEYEVVEAPCSTKFLHSLCLQLMRARSFPYARISRRVDKDQQKKRLRLLKHEFARLIKFPALFPSPVIRGRFLALVALDAELSFTAAVKDLLVENEVRFYDQSWRDQLTRVGFLKGSQDWENFMLNKAPGLQLAPKITTPKSSFQIIPIVGARIIADYEKEEAEIVRFVRNADVRLDIPPAATTLMVNFDNPHPELQRWPDTRMVYISHTEWARHHPFPEHHKVHLDLVRPGPEKLQTFSILTHRIEQPVVALQGPVAALNAPNYWATATLRTFRPPLCEATEFQFTKEKM